MELKHHYKRGHLNPDSIQMLQKSVQLGKYSRLRMDYLREHRQKAYTEMLLIGELNRCLLEIDERAYDLFDRLMVQMLKAEGITEALKAENQLEWIQRMNSIKSRANEIILHELVYT